MRRMLVIFAVACVAAAWAETRSHPGAATEGQRLSPRTLASGTVDGCEIAVEYGRPSKRGRLIWGGLVPWDAWWMPGADEATSLTTSAALMVGDVAVPAGEHTLYTVPGERTFLLTINSRTGQFHTEYSPNLDLGRVPMTLRRLTTPVEQLTFVIEAHAAGGGELKLEWDDRAYAVTLAASGDPGADAR